MSQLMRSLLWAAVIVMSGLGAAQAAGDAEAGKVKASTCMGCHGIPAYTNVYPTYHVPRLGGQSADYVVSALKAYKNGDRSHSTMHAQAKSLSDQDMADIAAFITSAPAAK
jgi:cytochrome c553